VRELCQAARTALCGIYRGNWRPATLNASSTFLVARYKIWINRSKNIFQVARRRYACLLCSADHRSMGRLRRADTGAVGQHRTRCEGMHGKRGIVGNAFSASCGTD
jgi:hypothetical protein